MILILTTMLDFAYTRYMCISKNNKKEVYENNDYHRYEDILYTQRATN